ncbi:MAG: ABC transporter permease subunit [Candidatus Eremiobacterota bacterium]
MSWVRIRAIAHKEWLELRRSRFTMVAIVLLPLIFLAITLAMMTAASSAPPGSGRGMPSAPPALRHLSGTEVLLVLLGDQMLFLQLMIPVTLPVLIASSSVVGEKERRSLEPLLATPVTTFELLTGKALSACLLPVLITWAGYAICALAGSALLPHPVFVQLVRPAWLVGIGLVAPALGIMAVFLALLVSSRVDDVRSAQQICGLFVLPIIGMSMATVLGKVFVSTLQMVLILLMLLVLDAVMVLLAVNTFERETVLTRWT